MVVKSYFFELWLALLFGTKMLYSSWNMSCDSKLIMTFEAGLQFFKL